MNPASAKKATVTEPLAAVKRRLRNRLRSSSGAAVRRSQPMNAASRAQAAKQPMIVSNEPQPDPGASMIVNTSNAIAAVDSTSPGRSGRGACGSREVGTDQATNAAPSAATGTIAKKMLVHEKFSSSQPPTIGPSAIAIPAVAPHGPIARARSARSTDTLGIGDR